LEYFYSEVDLDLKNVDGVLGALLENCNKCLESSSTKEFKMGLVKV
jgi:hypothetical protein